MTHLQDLGSLAQGKGHNQASKVSLRGLQGHLLHIEIFLVCICIIVTSLSRIFQKTTIKLIDNHWWEKTKVTRRQSLDLLRAELVFLTFVQAEAQSRSGQKPNL